MTDALAKLAELNALDAEFDESMYQQIVADLPSGLIVIDRNHRILLANPEAQWIFGFTADELVGQPVHLLIDESLRATHAEHLRRFFAHPVRRPMHSGRVLEGRTSEGDKIRVQIQIGPIMSKRHGRCAMAVVRRAE